ncbi:MAG: cytochrome P450 [Polyangiaceae bacterium]
MPTFEDIPLAPGGEGVLGHNAAFRRDRLGTLERLTTRTEPMLRLRLPFPGVRAAVVKDPDLVQEILVEKAKSFVKSDMLRFSLYPIAGEGLFTSNGELWRRQRKLMSPMFQPRALGAYAEDMVACSRSVVETWRDGQPLRLLDETTRLTMSVAGKTLFDAGSLEEARALGEALTVALEWSGWIIGRPFALAHIAARRLFGSLAEGATGGTAEFLEGASARFARPLFFPGARGRELARAIGVLDAQVEGMIERRRAAMAGGGRVPDDLLTRLLGAKDEDDGGGMTTKQLRDEVLTLFVAGHETTATGLAWSIYLATRAPGVYARMEAEVDALSGDPTLEDAPRLGHCLRVFREALRLYPPVYVFGRDSVGEVSIGGYELRARTNVMISPWVLHRVESVWPNARAFDPDRFLPERESERHRHAYMPFGAGPRVCIGNHFAYLEAVVALAVMLRRFRFESAEEDAPHPSATLRPEKGVRVIVRRR